jgi:heme/copper-type cytochrome/quinol oxidase subunit 3
MATTNGLVATITYGVIFTCIQAYEYNVAPFSINDGIFGSLFFMLTGFHGIHGMVLYLQLNTGSNFMKNISK